MTDEEGTVGGTGTDGPQNPEVDTPGDAVENESVVTADLQTRHLTRWGVAGYLLTVAAVVAAGVFWWQAKGQADLDRDSRQAADVAASSMQRLLTFNPATVTAEVPEEKKLLTGAFAEDYENQMVTKSGPSVVKNKITAQATIARKGVVSAKSDRVVVLIFANVARHVGAGADSEIVGARMRVVMKKVDGKWLISDYAGI